MNRTRAYLGLDGGGSHTRAVLLDDEGRVRARAQSGASNLLSVGPEAATRHVEDVLASVGTVAPTATVLAVAGAGRPAVRQHWATVLDRHGLAPFEIVGDYLAAWAAVTGGGPGLVAVVGTGSIVYAEDAAGHQRRIGGYGFRLGDPASGLGLAAAGLRAALAAREGWGPATVLESWLDEYGDTPADVLNWLYGETFRRDRLAARVPELLAAADAGDAVAERLVQDGIGEMIRQMAAAIRGWPWEPQWPVALAGGLGPALVARMAPLAAAGGIPAPTAPLVDAALGAAWLARRLARGGRTHD